MAPREHSRPPQALVTEFIQMLNPCMQSLVRPADYDVMQQATD
jgi:hypothetical protein